MIFSQSFRFRAFIAGIAVVSSLSFGLVFTDERVVRADTSIGNVPTDTSSDVTVINGINNNTTTVAVSAGPLDVAVNPVTNKIYVTNGDGGSVTVIDGADNSTTTVAAGISPFAVAVNPATNRIYVANQDSGNVTVINGENNSTTTVATGSGAQANAIAANPATNKIYVANRTSNTVTVIDGATNTTATVVTGTGPAAVAVNPITNRIYVPNNWSANVTVINGADNSTTTIAAGTNPVAVAVNPSTNRIYVVNFSESVTVIDGVNHSTSTITTLMQPLPALAVNPRTNRIYFTNNGPNVTVVSPVLSFGIPLNTNATPSFPANTATDSRPRFTLTATSTYSPFAPPPRNIYFQFDTTNGPWTKALNTGGTATTLTATAMPTGFFSGLQNGVHIIYFFATDGSDATSINPFADEGHVESGKMSAGVFAPESSQLIGAISSHLFLVKAPQPSFSTSVSGRVTTPDGRGLRNAIVTITDSSNVRQTAITSSFGFYSFEAVRVGETHTISVSSKRYRFASRSVTVSGRLSDVDFVGLE